MTALWARIEPLLGQVQKPARYIGCEDGAVIPRHGPGKVAWLLAYPDTYEVGLPNQGLQILYEILNERDDAVAERTYAPWLDLVGAAAPPRRAAVLGRHPPRRGRLRPARVQPVVRARVHERARDDRPRRRPGARRRPPARAPARRRRRALPRSTPSRSPTSSTLAVLGEGEEVVGEITEVVARLEARRVAPSREAVLRELAQVPGVYVPSMYEVDLRRRRPSPPITPRFADVPADRRQAHGRRPRRVAVPEAASSCRSPRSSTTASTSRCSAAARAAAASARPGMITRPVRERPAEQVRTMVATGLRRTGYDEVSLTSLSTADFSDIEPSSAASSPTAQAAAPGCTTTVNLPSLRVDAFTVGLAGAGQQRAAQRADVRARGRLVAAAPGDQQADHRGGPLRRRRRPPSPQGWSRMKLYFLTGLPTETDDDTLGIAELARNCVALGRRHTGRASVTASVGGFVPKPHTPFQWFGQNTEAELQRKVDLAAHARTRKAARRQPQVARPGGDRRRGHRQPRRPPHRARDRAGVARGRHVPGVGRVLRPRPLDRRDGGRGPVARLVRPPPPRPSTRCCRGTTSRPGCTRTSCGTTGRPRSPPAGVEDCRWTPCYDCGVCTGYGDRARRRLAGAAGRRQPGHRSGPRPRRRASPCTCRPDAGSPSGRGDEAARRATPSSARSASPATATRRAIWERALRRAELPRHERRVHAPARDQLRPGAADRRRVDRRVPRRRARSTGADRRRRRRAARARSTPLLPGGFDVLVAAEREPGGGSLQESVTSVTWEL